MQDTFDRLFTAKSLADRGTLSQLKNDFQHRSVTSTVMNCFNHAEDFFRFVTEAHVVYRALSLAGMDDVDSEPMQQFTSDDQKAQFVVDIAAQIVNESWLLPPMSDVKAVADCTLDVEELSDSWCICEEGNKQFLFRQLGLCVIN